jgi:hypothetical protein
MEQNGDSGAGNIGNRALDARAAAAGGLQVALHAFLVPLHASSAAAARCCCCRGSGDGGARARAMCYVIVGQDPATKSSSTLVQGQMPAHTPHSLQSTAGGLAP